MPTLNANYELARSQASRWLGEIPTSVQEQTGGLSGARVWRIESARGTFALRQYPVEFPTEERLQWLHRFLKEVQDRGCSLLPSPVATREGATWIEHDSQLWEMLSWIHGEALLETKPRCELLIAAVSALAQLHVVTSQLSYSPSGIFQASPPGLVERGKLARHWLEQDAAKVEKLLHEKSFPPKIVRLFQLQQSVFLQHAPALTQRIHHASQAQDRFIPVLRDVQPGHVIFNGKEVAGFIDLTAARVDSAMGDLARLLHRWRYTEPACYAEAVAAYHEIRPLFENERVVLDVYDYSARLLTGIQWLNWIVLEEREFANQVLVEQHWERIESDLEQLLDSGWSKSVESRLFLPEKWAD